MLKKLSKNLYTLEDTPQLRICYTTIRDRTTSREDFIFNSDRIIRLLVEGGLNLLPTRKKTVETPTGEVWKGVEPIGRICAVSIIRSGESMEEAAKRVCKKIRIGKILIQRNERTAEPILFYSKFPKDISNRHILLLDPMLATGGSVCKAIDVLKEKGVQDDRIIFVNLVSCPEGINKVHKNFPKVVIVTGMIDNRLNDKFYILPGLGDFGDRYFGTE